MCKINYVFKDSDFLGYIILKEYFATTYVKEYHRVVEI